MSDHSLVACNNRHFDIALFLLKKYKNELLPIVDQDGLTPLHLACQYGNMDVALPLIEIGYSVDAVFKSNQTTILHCACSGGNTALVTYLLKKLYEDQSVVGRKKFKFALEAKGSDDQVSALLFAIKNKYYEIVKLLINYGADTSELDQTQLPPDWDNAELEKMQQSNASSFQFLRLFKEVKRIR